MWSQIEVVTAWERMDLQTLFTCLFAFFISLQMGRVLKHRVSHFTMLIIITHVVVSVNI